MMIVALISPQSSSNEPKNVSESLLISRLHLAAEETNHKQSASCQNVLLTDAS